MIQFKKKTLGKSAILLLLFLTTTTTGFLRNNEDEHRTTRSDGNIRETLLSMDRREENIQVQNLPIRKLDIDRQINEKDSIAERLYDRRSFRTGTIERTSQNRDTTRASRDTRTDVRDFNNNRREIDGSYDRRSSNTLRENRRQIRETAENRRVTERAVIPTNRHSDEERRLSNFRTDRRNSEAQVRDLYNRLAPHSIIASQDQDRRTNHLQRRSVDLTTRLGERQEILNRQTENRVTKDREINQINRRSIQRHSTRENIPDNKMRSREVLNGDNQLDRRVAVRSLENQNRRFSTRAVDQTRSERRSTERLERRNSRDSRNSLEIRASNMDRQRSIERREDNVPRRIRTEIVQEQSERRTEASRFSTRSADRQNRRSSDRRNIERNLSFEDRRFTARNQDQELSLLRTADRTRSLDRQRSIERLERINSRDSRNSLETRASKMVDRQGDVERREDNVPQRRVTREDSERSTMEYRYLSADRQNRRSSDRRNIERNLSIEDRRSSRNQDRELSLLRTADRTQSLDRQRSIERLERRNSRDSRNSFETRASNMVDRQGNVERREDNVPQRRVTREDSERDTMEYRYSTRSADRQNRRSSDRRNIERNLSFEDRRSTRNQDRELSLLRTADQTRSLDRQRSIERLERRNSRNSRNSFETRASNIVDRQGDVEHREHNVPQRRVTREDSERDTMEYRYSTRSADRQNRRSSDRRNIERNLSFEDRRSTRNQNRELSLLRTADRARSLDRQRSTERLERARVRARNLETPADRQSRMSDRLRSTQPSVSRDDSTRRHSVRRQDMNERRRRTVDGREDRITRDDRVRGESRSDSARNTRDITQFKRDSRDNRITYRRDSRVSRENQRDNTDNRQRLNMSSKNEIVSTDRYDPLTADSRRYFEKLVSMRTTRDTERASSETARNVEGLKMTVDSNVWANTAKIVLAAFLIGQIFANSSKQNKFRFQNIMSMATLAKEKVQ